MKHITLMIKPASGLCNMRCKYCFYMDEQDNREVASFGMMSEETLENVVTKTLAAASHSCTFAFQGGEPTLRGLPFFELFTQLVKKHNKKSVVVSYALQTNGFSMSREWAAFFAKNNFLIGLSLDGVKATHDFGRKSAADSSGTYAKVLRASQLLSSANVQFNILTVVTKYTAESINEIYAFYKRSGFLHQQYIPCLDGLWQERGANEFSLTPSVYEKFLKALFDLYYRDFMQKKPVSVRYFDNLLGMLLGNPPESCGMAGICGLAYVCEADGGVYPCDFYALDNYLLGNLNESDYTALDKKREEIGFIEFSRKIDEQCKACRYLPICRGSCRRDREVNESTLEINYYCPAYKAFFEYAITRLEQMAALIQGGYLK